MLKQFIEQLSTDMGFEQALESNDDGSYSLRVEPDIDITLKEYPEATISFHTQLAPLPASGTEDFLFLANVANLLGKETGGAFLGLDSAGKQIVMRALLFEEPSYRVFHERLEEFANYADVWRLETIEFTKNRV